MDAGYAIYGMRDDGNFNGEIQDEYTLPRAGFSHFHCNFIQAGSR